jgi:hypothetical protein
MSRSPERQEKNVLMPGKGSQDGNYWTSVQRESDSIPQDGFCPGFARPALNRIIKVRLFSATLKRCSPLLKQRAPTMLGVDDIGSFPVLTQGLKPHSLLRPYGTTKVVP